MYAYYAQIYANIIPTPTRESLACLHLTQQLFYNSKWLYWHIQILFQNHLRQLPQRCRLFWRKQSS